MDLALPAAVASDADFLTEMLVHAAYWSDDGPVGSIEEVLLEPALAHYVAGWPRAGDLGVVAADQHRVGAAWLRLFTTGDPGYGFVDATIPEVSVGVARQWRGRGVGTELIETLITTCREARVPALSLGVERDNDARRLYERLGFARVAEGSDSLTMLLRL